MTVIAVSSNNTGPIAAILGGVAAIITAVGGLAAWRRSHRDHVARVPATEDKSHDEQSEAWRAIIMTQTEALITPLREEIGRQGEKIEALQEQLNTSTVKYGYAISYIRTLLSWIHVHISTHTDKEVLSVPDPHQVLQDDL